MNNKKIGLCHGCFDLCHIGHLLHFQEAKANCDFLIVSITSDRFVNKEFGRPIFQLSERKALIESLSPVNKVIISDFPTALKSLQEIKPNIYFKGCDYENSEDQRFSDELTFCKSIKCSIFITKSKKYSTTYFIKKCKKVNFQEQTTIL